MRGACHGYCAPSGSRSGVASPRRCLRASVPRCPGAPGSRRRGVFALAARSAVPIGTDRVAVAAHFRARALADAPDAPMISFDPQGLPYNTVYGDIYKSRAGAMDEAREVFVAGADVAGRWGDRERFTLLELGFGLGVNFLATLAAWRNDPHACRRLHFVSVEAHPADPASLARAHEALGVDGPDARRLREHWPLALPGLHRIDFADARVTLTIAIGHVHRILPILSVAADAFYLDGFAPARNPAMWDERTCGGLARRARPGATLATYTAAAPVRDALAAAGFEMALRRGFADKRHCLSGHYAPRWRTFAPPDAAPAWPRREALVIGAGLAGCATAASLARRGWRVRVLERRAGAAAEGSGQPVLADHLHLSPDDNPLARLTRAALLNAGEWSAARPIGRLALAEKPENRELQRAMMARLGFPQSYARAVERDEASELAGVSLRHGGVWLPLCRVADPARLSAGWLDTADGLLRARYDATVARLERHGDDWLAIDPSGDELDRAPVIVLAVAGEASALAAADSVALRRVRGQTTFLSSGAIGPLRTVLGGDAYACPLDGGGVLAGATFDEGHDLEPTRDADLSNLRRLARLLTAPSDAEGWVETALASARPGEVGFRHVARDRLPLIGAMPDERAVRHSAAELVRNDRLPLPLLEGLYGAFGYGSRGLLWATLGAEILAAALDGEPAPVESDLLGLIDPTRFVRRLLRRGRRTTG
jgi:tRNA 5-methylaminomethyl-2-thiouridine biosynthesis bifunctional protein